MSLCVFCVFISFLCCRIAHGQSKRDIDFIISNHLLAGKKIIRVKRDFYDPFVWVLAANNGVYRINSQTLNIDNYSSRFGAYSSSEAMIDIAGYDQDHSCIVTSSRLITLFNGVAGAPNPLDVITNTINSIAVRNIGNVVTQYNFLIGTESAAYYYYNIGDDELSPVANSLAEYTRFFGMNYESTYRTLMTANVYNTNTLDPSVTSLVNINEGQSRYIVDIWKGGIFGETPNTAFYTPTDIYDIGSQAQLYWGTDDGFFDVWNNNTQVIGSNYNHLLPGISVNKITDIYGLMNINVQTTSGQSVIKNNLLVGTANGFYFSNSIYHNCNNNLANITMFKYNALGNIGVNDVNVSTTDDPQYGALTNCESSVWVGTDDGLYILNPDRSKYADPNDELQAIYFAGSNANSVSMNLCSPDVALISVDVTLANNGITVQWYKDGQLIKGQTGNVLPVSGMGDYFAVITSPCDNIHFNTNHLQVKPCLPISIPNTFTPNGDNINDTWVVQGLSMSATVTVFSRYGGQVYKSIGYTTPWNGTYNGKKLPAGVYYYIITEKNGAAKYSGSITLVY